MESIDEKKLETAITYLTRLADGRNPINNMPAEEDSVLNNPNVIRCMFFVKDILTEIQRNGGNLGKKKKNKPQIEFPLDVLSSFSYKEDKAITAFVGQLNEMIDTAVYKKLGYKRIQEWLKRNGFLKDAFSNELDRTITVPTDKGLQIGIRAERRVGSREQVYIVIVYNQQAQEYIVRNMESILDGVAIG